MVCSFVKITSVVFSLFYSKKPGGESQETLEHLEGEEKIIPQNDASYTRENEMQIQPIIKLTDRN